MQINLWWAIGVGVVGFFVQIVGNVFAFGYALRDFKAMIAQIAKDSTEALSIAKETRTAHGVLALEVARHDERIEHVAETVKDAIEKAFAQGSKVAWAKRRH